MIPKKPSHLRLALLFTAAAAMTWLPGCAPPQSSMPTVGFLQITSNHVLDVTREGYMQGLADAGFVEGKTVHIIAKDAQGDMSTAQLMARDFVGEHVSLIGVASTPAMQASARATSSIPVVFSAVADPYIAGMGTSPARHKANVTGVICLDPVDRNLALVKEMIPGVHKVGTLFDPNEAFTPIFRKACQDACQKLGLQWVEVQVTSSNDIVPGVQALKAQGVEAIMQIPSTLIGAGISGEIQAANRAEIPFFTTHPSEVKLGAVAAVGWDFRQAGYDAGKMAARVLRGADPASIPFGAVNKAELVLNKPVAQRYHLVLPPAGVIPEVGVPTSPSAGSAVRSIPTDQPVDRRAAARFASDRASGGGFLSLALWSGALAQGLGYAFLGWGIFLTFRVLNFADITVDGSFTLGAAVAAVLLIKGFNPLAAVAAALAAGAAAGVVTGIFHTRFGISDLLSGILTMTALYSINLHVMGRANVALLDAPTLASTLQGRGLAWSDEWAWLAILGALTILGTRGLDWFLKTDAGMALRATGDNPLMITAQGVDIRQTRVMGLALANGLVGLSGALVAQYQGFADVSMGVGSMVAGLAAVILGESLMGRRSLPWLVTGVAVGSIVFRLLIALALQVGLDPIDLKLIMAVFVFAALAMSRMNGKEWLGRWQARRRAAEVNR